MSESLKVPSISEVKTQAKGLGQFDFVVPGGGHGAASVSQALLEKGFTVAGIANPIDEGGHSAGIRWDMYRHLGYWPIIPGDTMNLIGGGFAHSALYAVANSRLPKDTAGKKAGVLFGEAVDAVIAKRPADRSILEEFRVFMVAMGDAIQKELVETGLVKLSGASLQNVLHVGVMVHAGAYRKGITAIDEEKYICGSWMLERAMKCSSRGQVLPMSYDKVTLVTKHAGGLKVVGGINRVLLAKGKGLHGLEYGDMIPNFMLPDAPAESPEEEKRKLHDAKVVDWYSAEVEHGPKDQPFNNDWVFREVKAKTPRINPDLVRVLRALKSGGAIVIPPGNAHESTYTFFLLGGLWEELQAARARGVKVTLVCNPVNLLLTAGYTVDDYLQAAAQAMSRAAGKTVRPGEIIDKVVVNDPAGTSEKVQKMMRGEGIPREIKQVLLHRTPTGPILVSEEDKARLKGQGIEAVQKAMLSVETISIRGLETEAISYNKDILVDAIVGKG